MTAANGLKFFSTSAHPCSYLPEQQAVTLFADPKSKLNEHIYSELSDLGFRRSGNYLYRPHCGPCQACVPVRIPVDRFTASRSQQRNWKLNQDLEVSQRAPVFDEEHYALYERYIRERHFDGDMFPPSEEQYRSFLNSDWCNTCFYEFRLNGRLLAVAACDQLEQGLSAVYTFYDPDEAKRGLGTYAVLWQIEETRRLGLYALYLGYWIKSCQKMRYKIAYRPIELLINHEWLLAR